MLQQDPEEGTPPGEAVLIMTHSTPETLEKAKLRELRATAQANITALECEGIHK